MDKPLHILRGVFAVCFGLAAASILALNGYALALLAVLGVCWLLRRKPLPRFTLLLLIGGIVLRFAIAFVLHPPLESDFKMMFEAAQSLLAGDKSFLDSVYFSLWAYQSVFVAWEAMWLALWNNPLCLELVNAVLSAGLVCLIYRLARGFVRERAAQAAALILTLFPFALTLHTVLSNQIPSAFLLTLGLWLLVCGDCDRLGFWRFPLAGLALQLGNLLRSEGLIFLVAVLAWAVFEGLRRPEAVKRLLAGLLALLVVYFGAGAAANGLVRAAGLNPYGTQNGDPGWKFVTGLNFSTAGGYSNDDWALIYPTLDENHQATDATDAVQKQLISERLHAGPVKLARHMVNKVRFLWGSDALIWAFGHTQQNPAAHAGPLSRAAAYDLVKQFDRGLFLLALGLAAFGLFGPKKRWERRPAAAYLPYFVVFAAFCALLLIEVQPRYAYLPQLFVFLGAGYGLDRLGKERENA
ncbi:MAG: glycosyltransferase family 39 protein [Eubacteriales bacterium]|nr:glycosyltransferase family 39 protein [Eubacteriales bacterium]